MIRTIVVLILIGIAVKAALGQDGHIGHGHEKWHQHFYQQLQRPDMRGASCCNLTDCRPTSGRVNSAGQYEVKVNGQWVIALETKIVRKSAPDGGFHVCAPYHFNGAPENIFCIILAPEG